MIFHWNTLDSDWKWSYEILKILTTWSTLLKLSEGIKEGLEIYSEEGN